MKERVQARQLHGSRGTHIDRFEIANRRHADQYHRHDAMHHAEGDLGRQAEPADQQHDGIQRHLGDRIERDQQRLGDIARQVPHA